MPVIAKISSEPWGGFVRDIPIDEILDLDRYPLEAEESPALGDLIERCRADLERSGMFNLDRFVRQPAIERAAEELLPLLSRFSFTHRRRHNVYFDDGRRGLAPDHPALRRFDTINHTLCDDQLVGTAVHRIYEWLPLARFIARILGKPALFLMEDPLARANVLEYRAGEALNWHFDRSAFTTTLLIQAAERGGEFEYRSNLRSEEDQNYDGVGEFLAASDPPMHTNALAPGTLNVFEGRNTLHRVSPVVGSRSRLVAVFSYYERPGVRFSDAESLGFYGRAAKEASSTPSVS